MSRALRSRWDDRVSSVESGDAGRSLPFDLEAASEPARGAPSLDRDALELLRRAEELEIPWKRILSEEVVAETVLRRFLGADLRGTPMWRFLSILHASPLHSWRVRERVDLITWETSQGSRRAREELTQLHAMLSGAAGGSSPRRSALATHQWLAYERVLELRAIGELAPLAPNGADPAEFLIRSLGCSRHDADWAVGDANSGNAFRALERAMRRARDEGFEIPHAENEREAFLRLRASVRRHGFIPKRAPARKRLSSS